MSITSDHGACYEERYFGRTTYCSVECTVLYLQTPLTASVLLVRLCVDREGVLTALTTNAQHVALHDAHLWSPDVEPDLVHVLQLIADDM